MIRPSQCCAVGSIQNGRRTIGLAHAFSADEVVDGEADAVGLADGEADADGAGDAGDAFAEGVGEGVGDVAGQPRTVLMIAATCSGDGVCDAPAPAGAAPAVTGAEDGLTGGFVLVTVDEIDATMLLSDVGSMAAARPAMSNESTPPTKTMIAAITTRNHCACLRYHPDTRSI
jgi:hypothetical protein